MTIPVEAGNKAVKDGTIEKLVQSFSEGLNPEAQYFYTENGKRTALFVFDLEDPSQIPQLAEPFFTGLNADVSFSPVMNAEDLKRGIEKANAGFGKVAAGSGRRH
jgi:hypothetical protein